MPTGTPTQVFHSVKINFILITSVHDKRKKPGFLLACTKTLASAEKFFAKLSFQNRKNRVSLEFPYEPRLFALCAICFLAACGSASSDLPAPTLTPIEAKGKEVFNLHCATCHSTSPDTVIVGPPLAGVATRAGERVEGMDAKTYLQTSILKPGAYIVEGFPDSMLPNIAKQLSGEEFDAVVAYLLTLK